jgi:outer membrane protein assembly factor BamB
VPDAAKGKPHGIGPAERPPAPDTAGYSRTASPAPALHPPLRVRILAVSSAVIAWLVLRFDLTGDHSVSNILALIGLATAVATILVWFLRNAAFPWAWRRATIALLIVLLLSAWAVVRIDQVSGDLMPRFRFVWTLPPDARLELTSPTLPSDGISLATTTPDDFPQFLGPDRSGVLASVQLNPDWNAHPPQLVWKQPIGAGWSGFAAVNGFAVTLEQRGEQELVTCYRAETGELLWYHGIPARHESVLGGVGPRSTPTIHEGRVYALGATGVLRCLDGADGTLIWSRDLLAEFGVLPVRITRPSPGAGLVLPWLSIPSSLSRRGAPEKRPSH